MLANFTQEQIKELALLLNTFGSEEIQRQYKQTVPYLENQYFKVTAEVQVPANGSIPASIEYKAVEVQPNGTEVSNGIVFDSDQTPTSDIGQPIYLPNLKFNSDLFSGSVEVGKAYQVEEVDSDTFGEASSWYIIPKGGAGGGAKFYALFKGLIGDQIYYCDIYSSGSFESNSLLSEDSKVKVFNVDFGEILNGSKLSCYESDEVDLDYYAEAATWQQGV